MAYINWNFNPELINIFGLSVRWYGMMFFLSFSIGLYLGEKMFRYEKVNPAWINSLFYYLIIATIIGARLGHVFFYDWDYYSQNPGEILMIRKGGLASHGGALGIMIAMLLYSRFVTKRSVLWILDRVVVPTALAAFFIRMGNLFNSEIYGVETTLPWGFIFERNGEQVAKHPTQIYEALCYIISFGVLMVIYWKSSLRNKSGYLLGLFFVLIFTARFFIEFVKENQEVFEEQMVLNMGQWLSIPFVLGGIVLMVRAQKRPEKVYLPYKAPNHKKRP